MSYDVAKLAGWTPYDANPEAPKQSHIFRDIARPYLVRLRAITNQVHGHPAFAPDYATCTTMVNPTACDVRFDLQLHAELVRDILASPDAIQLALHGSILPMKIINGLSNQYERLDAATRIHTHYAAMLHDLGRQAMGVLQSAFASLCELEGVEAALVGKPPESDEDSPCFGVSFRAYIPDGWYTCPRCGSRTPDTPMHHDGNVPQCFIC